jgi:hypothetical protein
MSSTIIVAIIILVLVMLIIFGLARLAKNINAPKVEAEDTKQDAIKLERRKAWWDFRRDRWGRRKGDTNGLQEKR